MAICSVLDIEKRPDGPTHSYHNNILTQLLLLLLFIKIYI